MTISYWFRAGYISSNERQQIRPRRKSSKTIHETPPFKSNNLQGFVGSSVQSAHFRTFSRTYFQPVAAVRVIWEPSPPRLHAGTHGTPPDGPKASVPAGDDFLGAPRHAEFEKVLSASMFPIVICSLIATPLCTSLRAKPARPESSMMIGALKAQGLNATVRRQRIDEVLARVRLEEFGGFYPARLSGGQQQRVAIARALVAQPLAILMDEPLSNLDDELKDELCGHLLDLHSQLGFTLVYVTHSKEEMQRIGTRTILLRHGKEVPL